MRRGADGPHAVRCLSVPMAAALLLSAPLVPAWAGGCEQVRADAAMAVEAQRWREHDAHGRQLVSETAALPRMELRVQATCARQALALELGATGGERDHQGQSNLGRPVRTTAHWRAGDASLAWWPQQGRLGLRLAAQRARRELRGSGNALGYVEIHRAAEIALGWRLQARGEHGGAGAARWDAQAWIGGHGGGRVDVDLPHADPATLRTGPALALLARVQMTRPMRDGSAWTAGLSAQWRRTHAGPAHTLAQDGRVVGAVFQPETDLQALTLRLGWVW